MRDNSTYREEFGEREITQERGNIYDRRLLYFDSQLDSNQLQVGGGQRRLDTRSSPQSYR